MDNANKKTDKQATPQTDDLKAEVRRVKKLRTGVRGGAWLAAE